MPSKTTFFVSSTYEDLSEYRKAVIEALDHVSHVIRMETFHAEGRPVVRKCLEDVASCDVYVGIFAWRYGYQPPGWRYRGRSMTELELREAQRLDKELLVFVLDPNAPWPASKMDADRRRINELRALLPDYCMPRLFDSDPRDLLVKVVQAVDAWYDRTGRPRSSSRDRDVSVHNLRPPAGEHLFGRDRELNLLDDAWHDPGTRVLSVVGFGGQGKTSLVFRWLNRMGQNDWDGAERVFGWSFYRHGTRPGRSGGSEEFVAKALEWFERGDASGGGWRAWSDPGRRGELLAKQVRQHRSVLVLDGLEPLQEEVGSGAYGRVTDPALRALLRDLAAENPGLCVITSRTPLAQMPRGHRSLELGRLSSRDGVLLLRALGVRGRDPDLEEAVDEQRGYPLALTLLATQLCVYHHCDIRSRASVLEDLRDDPTENEAFNAVMDSYVARMQEGPDPTAELALRVLRLIGLSEGPTEWSALRALSQEPIEGLTDRPRLSWRSRLTRRPVPVSGEEWRRAVGWLRELRLLAPHVPGGTEWDVLDAHPMVREHFAERLRSGSPAAWQQGHDRLYRHLTDDAPSSPRTIDELTPLFKSLHHASGAGRLVDAFTDVYVRRIRQEPMASDGSWDRIENVHFSVKRLGAVSADLDALTEFVETRWERARPELEAIDQAWVLLYAGLDLRLLGRLSEARQALTASWKQYAALGGVRDAKQGATTACRHLCQVDVLLGELEQALETAGEAVRLAGEVDGSPKDLLFVRASRADVLHQLGRDDEAEGEFAEAIRFSAASFPDTPLLWGLPGFRYCDFLLGQGQSDAALRHTLAVSAYPEARDFLYGALLGSLIALRASRGVYPRQPPRALAPQIDGVIQGLRTANQQHGLALGLLARAELRREMGDVSSAWADLREAEEVAGAGEMALTLSDVFLTQARLYADGLETRKAVASLERARRSLEQQGYARRRTELAELDSRTGSLAPSRRKDPRESLPALGAGSCVPVVEIDLQAADPRDLERSVEHALSERFPEEWQRVQVVGTRGRETVVLEGEPEALAEIVRSILSSRDVERAVVEQLSTAWLVFAHAAEWYTVYLRGGA